MDFLGFGNSGHEIFSQIPNKETSRLEFWHSVSLETLRKWCPHHVLVAMPVKKCVRCPQIAIGVRSWNWLTPFLIPRINNETMTSLKLACKQISPTMNFFSQGILQLFDYTTTDHCEFWGYLAEWPRSIVLLPDPKTPNPSDENAPLPRPDAWPNLATRQANFLLIWSTFLKFSVKTSISCQKSDVHVRWQSHHYHCNQLAKSFPASAVCSALLATAKRLAHHASVPLVFLGIHMASMACASACKIKIVDGWKMVTASRWVNNS